MDKKYLGATLPIPKDTLVVLERVRERLKEVFGFVPSRSETVAYLAFYYEKNNPVAPVAPVDSSETTGGKEL